MEKKLRCVHIMACSNLGTRIQLTLFEETADIRHLISMALIKVSSIDTDTETYYIEHIDSIPYLRDSEI